MWHVGAPSSTVIDASPGIGSNPAVTASISPTDDGRIWVGWEEGDAPDAQIVARLSNADVTGFGPRVSVNVPAAATSVWRVYVAAGDDVLDVFALMSVTGQGLAFWHTQLRAPIEGSSAGETLTGTSGDDIVSGLGGDDILKGLEGNDDLLGGGGNDEALGGEGRDALKGGGGNDKLDGGRGKDRLVGGKGNDVCIRGKGDGDSTSGCEKVVTRRHR